MASVTLGQHPARNYLDSEKRFLCKYASDGKKLKRKPSVKMIAVRRVSLNNEPSSDASGSASQTCTDAAPRTTDRSVPDCNPVGKDAAQTQTISRADGQNANDANNEVIKRSVRRSSTKNVIEPCSRRLNFKSLSAGEETLDGLQLERLTQGRTGVVKLMRTEQPRMQAWSIFTQDGPRMKEEKGEGHLFVPYRITQDWCDACNCLIRATAIRCDNCSYTCHLECESLVQLDCNQKAGQKEETPTDSHCTTSSTPPPVKNAVKEDQAENSQPLTEDEVKAKIEEYNSKASENGMKMSGIADDGTYTGFIKVHLKLRRPVTVVSAELMDSRSNLTVTNSDKRTSFYLPNEATNQLHIRSTTTVSEVIEGLLKKFMVQDNPRKFALYKQTHRHGQDLFQKLLDSENPLYLRLLAGPDLENLSFVLKENETGEVEWHAFSVPELQNFLAILEKEERERVKQVEQRYVAYREKLLEALQEVQNKPD